MRKKVEQVWYLADADELVAAPGDVPRNTKRFYKLNMVITKKRSKKELAYYELSIKAVYLGEL
jgi:hypothetical protein